MAQARDENFSVAGRFLPPAIRNHLLAIYGFARLVDDIGDEAPGDRTALLDWLEGQLRLLFEGKPTEHPLLDDLGATIRALDIPPDPFERLIAANRRDQEVTSYATIEDLYAYCELSANPVGHLVLYVFGAATPDRIALSDKVCTALQLVEHWQDVREDLRQGRVYIPESDMDRFNCAREDLRRSPAPPNVRALLAFECSRASRLLDAGQPLAETLRGRPRLAICGFVGGGRAALEAIRRANYDVSAGPPRATRTMRLWATLGAMRHRPHREMRSAA